MKRWLAHYDLTTEIKIVGTLAYRHPKKSYQLSAVMDEGDTLACKMTYEAGDIDDAARFAEAQFQELTYRLAVATSTAYRIKSRRCIIDWTPGLRERDILIFRTVPPEQSIGELQAEELNAVLNFMEACDIWPTAMRWYCAGTRAEIPDDQFIYFFYAIELLAERTKSSVKVRSKCQKCGGSLRCEACGDANEHRPFKTQAIDELLRMVRVEEGAIKTLMEIRNGLSHGGNTEAIEHEICKRDPDFRFGAAVDLIGRAAWNALFVTSSVPKDMQVPPFTHVSSFGKYNYRAGFHLTIAVSGDPFDPQYEQITLPHVTLTVE